MSAAFLSAKSYATETKGKCFAASCKVCVCLAVCVANGKWMPQNVAIFSIFPLCCHCGRISHAHAAHQMHRFVATSQYQLSPIGRRFSSCFSSPPSVHSFHFPYGISFFFFFVSFFGHAFATANNHNSYLLMCSICF